MAPKSGSERAARLLLKALKGLTERERDVVVGALLSGSLRGVSAGLHRPAVPAPSLATEIVMPPMEVSSRGPMEVVAGQERVLPVRLPNPLHERLRRWSTDHGFSMAAVVRVLVERFLDQQDQTGR